MLCHVKYDVEHVEDLVYIFWKWCSKS